MRSSLSFTLRALPLAPVLMLSACTRLFDLDALTGGADMDSSMPDAAPPHDAGRELDATMQHDAGRDAGADATVPDAGPALPCPTTAGMTMSRIRVDDHSFCIDQTEVTQAQFQMFLDASPELSVLLTAMACSGVTDVTPIGFPSTPALALHPVTGVTFCGAQAYCNWANKTLCGDSAGGKLELEDLNDPTRDAWARACAGAEGRSFPYADDYEPAQCNGADKFADATSTTPVKSLAACVTPDSDVYDLSGNVWEWTDACERDFDVADPCRIRGGADNSPEAQLACDYPGLSVGRGSQRSDLGFRCCAP